MPKVDLNFPAKGVTEITPHAAIPGGYTHRDGALNVRPFDSTDEALRGGKRPGSGRFIDSPAKAGFQIQRLTQGRTAIVPGTEAGAYKVKYADPATLPISPGSSSAVDFHPSGTIVVFGLAVPPFLIAYKFDPVTGFGAKLTDAATAPPTTPAEIRFSPDGKFMAVTTPTTPFLTVYNFSTAGFGTKVADPVVLPVDAAKSVAWHPTSTALSAVVLDSGTSDTLIEAWNFSSTGFGTKFTSVTLGASLGTPGQGSLDFTPDGIAISAGVNTGARIFALPFSLTTGFGAAFAGPSPPLAAGGAAIRFHPSGNFIAIGQGTISPKLIAYQFSSSSGFGTKLTDPSPVPTNAVTYVNWTNSGTAIVTAGSPPGGIDAYEFKNAFGAKFVPTVGINHPPLAIVVHPDDLAVAVATASAAVPPPAKQEGYPFVAPFFGSIRNTKLAVVSGGDVLISDSPPTTLTLATGGSGAIVSDELFMAAVEGPPSPTDAAPGNIQQHIYYADGATYKKLNLVTDTVITWTANAGTLPTDAGGNTARLMAFFNGRIVLAGFPDDSSNWFASSAVDVSDWDFFPANFTETSAISGTSALFSGKIGDIITCLAVHNRDTMIFGGDASIWRMTGDPAAGGRIDNISPDVGILGGEAFTLDPSQTLYFMGTNGFNRLPSGQLAPEQISSGKLDKTFRSINRAETRVILVWNRDRQGCHIFLQPIVLASTAPEHFWYDQRTDSFWPEKYPASNGPSAAISFDGDRPLDRAVLLGGLDSVIRASRLNRVNDDDTDADVAIDSFVDIPLLSLAGISRKQRINDMSIVLGKESGAVNMEIFAGKTPESALDATSPRTKRTLGGGRNIYGRDRVADNSLRIRLSQNVTDATWSYEEGSANLDPTGRVRGGAK